MVETALRSDRADAHARFAESLELQRTLGNRQGIAECKKPLEGRNLIAAIGDSYASGEGNPHSPAQYDWLGFATRGAIWAQCGDDLESIRRPAILSTPI